MCGEYGEATQRPHYHAILFGYKFPDQYLWSERRGNKVYRSELLEKTWYHGNSEIGNVSFQSAAYVARYVMKKRNGEKFKHHYEIVDPDTGEVLGQRLKEYTNMSLKPGIGEKWYQRYKTDIFPEDRVVHDGKEMQTPKYYREILKREEPDLYEKLRARRVIKAIKNTENTPQRLDARENANRQKQENS